MITRINLDSDSNMVKNKLVSIPEPKNPILARLKNHIVGNKNECGVCSYSRMHNRHNRS